MTTGRITFPIREPELSYLRSVRRGEVELQEILSRGGELEREIKDLLDTSPLRSKPDVKAVEDWLLRVYEYAWQLD